MSKKEKTAYFLTIFSTIFGNFSIKLIDKFSIKTKNNYFYYDELQAIFSHKKIILFEIKKYYFYLNFLKSLLDK